MEEDIQNYSTTFMFSGTPCILKELLEDFLVISLKTQDHYYED